jgi:hypothetical protein
VQRYSGGSTWNAGAALTGTMSYSWMTRSGSGERQQETLEHGKWVLAEEHVGSGALSTSRFSHSGSYGSNGSVDRHSPGAPDCGSDITSNFAKKRNSSGCWMMQNL